MKNSNKTDNQNQLMALEQIIDIANSANEPVQFTINVAGVLLDNGLISKPVFEILAGEL